MSKPAGPVQAADYLRSERAAEFKSDLIDGRIQRRQPVTRAHARISLNVLCRLHSQLKGRCCDVFSSDVRIAAGAWPSFFYPDGSVACDPLQFTTDLDDTLLNPTVLLEVVLPQTSALDRGRKWAEYRELPSLRHYLLVTEDYVWVELYTRRDDGWLYQCYTELDDIVTLPAIGCRLLLADVYETVEFAPAPPDPTGEDLL